MKMSTDYNLKAVCSVIEMAKQLDLSRTSFYQLWKEGLFPETLRCAQRNLSCKYVLEGMGHSFSAILDMYFTINDSQAHISNRNFPKPPCFKYLQKPVKM